MASWTKKKNIIRGNKATKRVAKRNRKAKLRLRKHSTLADIRKIAAKGKK